MDGHEGSNRVKNRCPVPHTPSARANSVPHHPRLPENFMKSLALFACVWLLSSCSSAPVMQTSVNGYGFSSAPTSASDPRLRQPRFYMDERDSMPWLNAAPRNNQ